MAGRRHGPVGQLAHASLRYGRTSRRVPDHAPHDDRRGLRTGTTGGEVGAMKVGICTVGVGPCSTGDFIRRSARASEKAGFASFWAGDHVVLFGAYPESPY